VPSEQANEGKSLGIFKHVPNSKNK
jgi:hypothetical protein